MPKRTQPPDRRDAEIQKLQANLHCARATIVDLVPKPHRDWLEMATLCGNFKDFDAWQAWAIDGLTRGADARPGPEMGGVVGQFRAFCPLCGEGSQAAGLLGYAMPTGLERHLAGSHGSHMCRVFEAAHGNAIERARWEFMPGVRMGLIRGAGLKPWERKEPAAPQAPKQSATVHKLRPD